MTNNRGAALARKSPTNKDRVDQKAVNRDVGER